MSHPDSIANLPTDRAADGTRFFWVDHSARDKTVLLSQTDFARPSLQDDANLLKSARQRFIYRCVGPDGSKVVKLFPLNLLSSLHPRKYALTEFEKTRAARALGLPVPDTYAYIEQRKWGRTTCVGAVFEDLNGYRELSKLLRRQRFTVAECGQIAAQALTELYAAGANHLDGRDANIMVHPDTRAMSIIDWQYAEFVAPRADWLLEHLAGFYLQRSPQHSDAYLDAGWLRDLHTRSSHPISYDTFSKRVLTLSSRKRPLSERAKLLPVAD
ncbi:lipopolysaccharide kinase InaA family protein [uncultured Tateyamaria sp.]|uniref:lipopolysaccharide kinase InaA family protein n=1 Tax=uncultured Tateyamaria sp. TaxID=455651 RepID=UPI0026076B68|nr:lipopolysaccharide kinase InaA family protein [uncultured Tateyamaria sp.]